MRVRYPSVLGGPLKLRVTLGTRHLMRGRATPRTLPRVGHATAHDVGARRRIQDVPNVLIEKPVALAIGPVTINRASELGRVDPKVLAII